MSSGFDRSYFALTRAYVVLHDPSWLRPDGVDEVADRERLFEQRRQARLAAQQEFGRYRQPVRNDRWVAPDVVSPGSTSWSARFMASIGAVLVWLAIALVAYYATAWTR